MRLLWYLLLGLVATVCAAPSFLHIWVNAQKCCSPSVVLVTEEAW